MVIIIIVARLDMGTIILGTFGMSTKVPPCVKMICNFTQQSGSTTL